jgi:hypothetical protein
MISTCGFNRVNALLRPIDDARLEAKVHVWEMESTACPAAFQPYTGAIPR